MRRTFKRKRGVINKIEYTCPECGEAFHDWKSNKRVYCSRECLGKAMYKKGLMKTTHQHLIGENNHNWKGDDVGYSGVHMWLRKEKGKPKICEHCGTTEGKLEWASIDGTLKRDADHYISLCTSCHRKHDGHFVENPSYNTLYMRNLRKKGALA